MPPIGDEDKPFEFPEGWEWARSIAITENHRDISYGIIRLEIEPASGGVFTLRCSDVKPGFINLSGVRRVSPDIEESYKRTRLKGGEVLVNIRGTLGGVALVPEELIGYNIAREVALIPRHQNVIGAYLVYTMMSPYFWNRIESNLKGIAYKGLNLKLLSNFLVPVAPSEEQQRIVAKVDELMTLCGQLKARLNTAQTTQLDLADAVTEQAIE